MTTDACHKCELNNSIETLKEKIANLELAFPEGAEGIKAHRAYHDSLIKEALNNAEFVKELKLEAAKKGLWVLALVVTGIFVIGLQVKLKAFFGGV